jgi:AraC family transcriptional regulator of adaptative response/methylated-DNA-[protein]-cysteine methyltransferase
MNEALQQIKRGARIDEVALGNGYDSHSGFREAFARTFGQPPGKGRQTGCVVVTWTESPLGPLLLGATDEGVCLLEFTDRRALETQIASVRRWFQCAIVPGRNGHLDHLQDELERYFAGTIREFCVRLVYPGSPFQRQVWSLLLRIPYGETRSYEDVARALGCPAATRAVGRANGQNRIAIVIPCHRVVNKGGQLGGYGGGLWRKQFLLDMERGKSPTRPRE